jgi:hypothetical protein
MVLPTYQSLKSSQESMPLTSSAVVMRRASTSSSVPSGPSCLNLSALTLSDSHQSATRLNSFNSTNQATLKRGWGSAETRRASTSLCTMTGQVQVHQRYPAIQGRPVTDATNTSSEKDGWGYFVDVAEEDEEALMW